MTRVFTPAELAALTPQAALDMRRTVLESARYWSRIATGDTAAVRDTFGRDVFADTRVGDRFLHEGYPCTVVETDGGLLRFTRLDSSGYGGGFWMFPDDVVNMGDAGEMFAIGVAPAMVAGVGG